MIELSPSPDTRKTRRDRVQLGCVASGAQAWRAFSAWRPPAYSWSATVEHGGSRPSPSWSVLTTTSSSQSRASLRRSVNPSSAGGSGRRPRWRPPRLHEMSLRFAKRMQSLRMRRWRRWIGLRRRRGSQSLKGKSRHRFARLAAASPRLSRRGLPTDAPAGQSSC
jgi:hypothetical protein